MIRSSYAVIVAAKSVFQNCAAEYIRRCEHGDYILAILKEDEKPKAIGGYRKSAEGWLLDNVFLKQNKPAPTETRAVFDDFTEEIQKWEDGKGSQ